MKAMLAQKELERGFDIVRRAMEGGKSAYFPATANIRIATADPFLELTATNLETTITARIAARIDEPGEACVSGRLAYEYVHSLSGDMINIENETDKSKGSGYDVVIRSNRNKSTIQGIDPANFPVASEVMNDQGKCQIGSQDLREAINRVAFATAKEEARPILQGCQLTIGDVDWRLTATDGFRLATQKGQLLSQDGNLESIVLPKRALMELARILRDRDVPVMIHVSGSMSSATSFEMGEGTPGYVKLTCQMLQGTYPDWEKLIPSDNKIRLLLDTKKAASVVKSAALFATTSNNIIRFQTSTIDQETEDGKTEQVPHLNISARGQEIGDFVNTIPLLAMDGDQGRIAFASSYITDALSIMGDKTVIDLGEDRTAALIRFPDSDDYLQIVMPMFVDWNVQAID